MTVVWAAIMGLIGVMLILDGIRRGRLSLALGGAAVLVATVVIMAASIRIWNRFMQKRK